MFGRNESCKATRSNVKINQMSARQVQPGSDLFDGSDRDADADRQQILIFFDWLLNLI